MSVCMLNHEGDGPQHQQKTDAAEGQLIHFKFQHVHNLKKWLLGFFLPDLVLKSLTFYVSV